ncbi:MAG: sugar ABC transporter ATP-binding protein [Actinomycetota bacterium]
MSGRSSDPPKIECDGLTKRFGGTVALDDVSVSIRRGRIHAIVGENGAGKSTLGKAIAGVHVPDEGVIRVDGAPVVLRSPGAALRHSITMVAQELSLLPGRSVVENVVLGTEARRGPLLRPMADLERFEALVAEHGIRIDPHAIVGRLSVAEQQKVEILRALARNAEVIVMDEPTARLSSNEAESLAESVHGLADRGVTVVFVSHFLDEVLGLADHITVMRNGRVVRNAEAADETKASLIEGMVGRSLDATFPTRHHVADDTPTVLEVDRVSRAGAFEDVSFSIRAGEIVTLAGLVGAGRSEVARAVFGADRPTAGTLRLHGEPYRPRSPRDAISRGVAMIPESRRSQGLFLRRTVRGNISLAHLDEMTRSGIVRRATERERATGAADDVNLTGGTVDSVMGELSGGNQQKSLFARWMVSPPRLLIADEPTRGVDVGAKRGIYDLLVRLAADGMAILVVSSEIEEVLGLAHRILVMRSGRLVGELDGERSSGSDVMELAFGMEAA